MPLMNEKGFYFIIQDSNFERVDDKLIWYKFMYYPTERKYSLEFTFY